MTWTQPQSEEIRQIITKMNQLRLAQGLTFEAIAQRCGLSAGVIGHLLNYRAKGNRRENLSKIANALGVTLEELQSVPDVKDYFGISRIACVTPKVKVADCNFNSRRIVTAVKKAFDRGANIALLPELSITGYTCGDLFFSQTLISAALDGLQKIMFELSALKIIAIVGLPLCGDDGRLYNVAAVCYHGEVLGVVPKKNLPNYNEFMEKRYFCAYDGENTTVRLFGKDVPFGTKLVFADVVHSEFTFGVEICEDLWVADSPSIGHAAAGANAIFNLSSSNETIEKSDYRKSLVQMQSAKCGVIYAYCSSGMDESTSTTVFSAHNLICENGKCLAESEPFGEGLAEAAADFDFIRNERARLDRGQTPQGYQRISFAMQLTNAPRFYHPTPFVPEDEKQLKAVCERTLEILAQGLKRRIEAVKAKKLVIGVSGGSDSTLALFVCQKALRLLNRLNENIIGVTMPCFGTSKRTYNNSVALMEALEVQQRTVDITAAVTQHLRDIGHKRTPNIVYQNAQARERTQVLMDIANAEGGLVVGTGDMSEAALGWSTFNGDQMSMYAAIASVPKTLVMALLRYLANKYSKVTDVLNDILSTPASPELLPTDSDGNIAQVTENEIGPYQLHDYFLYMLLRKGFAPRKVYEMAKISFAGIYDDQTVLKWLKFFVERFVSQQFKRSCTPDSVRLGSVDLSKYAMRLPSDIQCNVWLNQLENL